jgi:hypothetical protein
MSAPRKGAIQTWPIMRGMLYASTSALANVLPEDVEPPALSAPVNLVAPSVMGTPEIGQTLTRMAGSWSGNPAPNVTWQWTADAVDISGETADTLLLEVAHEGALISGYETATNSQGSAQEPSSNSLGPVTNPDAVTLVDLTLTNNTISESAVFGNTVGSVVGAAEGSTFALTDNGGGNFSINPATGLVFVANTETLDYETATSHSITVRETNSNGTNSPHDTILTVFVTDVDESVPANSTAPHLMGTAETGETLSIMNGDWTGNPSSYTYQWYTSASSDGSSPTAISGATNNTYVLTVAEEGLYVLAGVVGVNSFGSSTEALTDVFGPVTAPVEPTLTAPVLTLTSTSGANPPEWDAVYTDVITDRDTIRLNWRVDGGTWQSEDHLLVSDDLINGDWPWPAFAAASFPAGAFVEVREAVIRDAGEVGEAVSDWSNIVSDTMAAEAWHPSDLFTASEYGFVLDPSADAEVYQDTAATTPAGADDPVGLIVDTSPNGVDFEQATSTKRPIRKVDANGSYLEFDGTDDILVAQLAGLYDAGLATIIFAVDNANIADAGAMLSERNSASGSAIYHPFTETTGTTGTMRLFIRRDDNTTIKNTPRTVVAGSPFGGGWHMAVVTDSGTSAVVERTAQDGTEFTTGGDSYTRSGTLTLNRTGLGGAAANTESLQSNMRIGRMVAIGRALTTTELDQVKTWVAANNNINYP